MSRSAIFIRREKGNPIYIMYVLIKESELIWVDCGGAGKKMFNVGNKRIGGSFKNCLLTAEYIIGLGEKQWKTKRLLLSN